MLAGGSLRVEGCAKEGAQSERHSKTSSTTIEHWEPRNTLQESSAGPLRTTIGE